MILLLTKLLELENVIIWSVSWNNHEIRLNLSLSSSMQMIHLSGSLTFQKQLLLLLAYFHVHTSTFLMNSLAKIVNIHSFMYLDESHILLELMLHLFQNCLC
jgi:hypothetical protein